MNILNLKKLFGNELEAAKNSGKRSYVGTSDANIFNLKFSCTKNLFKGFGFFFRKYKL